MGVATCSTTVSGVVAIAVAVGIVVVAWVGWLLGSNGTEATLFIKGLADVADGAGTSLFQTPGGTEALAFIGQAFQATSTVFLTFAGFAQVSSALAGVIAAELTFFAVVVGGASIGVNAATIRHTKLIGEAVFLSVFALGGTYVLVTVTIGAALFVGDTGVTAAITTDGTAFAIVVAGARFDAESFFTLGIAATVGVGFAKGAFSANTGESTRAVVCAPAGASRSWIRVADRVFVVFGKCTGRSGRCVHDG